MHLKSVQNEVLGGSVSVGGPRRFCCGSTPSKYVTYIMSMDSSVSYLHAELHSNQQTSVENTEEEQFLTLQEDGPPPNPHYGDELKNIPKEEFEETAETEGGGKSSSL